MVDHQTLLKDHGMKATSQRLSILNSLEEKGHATLDEIYESVRPANPTMSLATVYRNINEMVEKEIIDEVRLPRQKQHYEISKPDHIHLICEECASVEDFTMDTSAFLREVETKSGTQVINGSIALKVRCVSCLKKSSS